jgi:tetratricopeptide (TPR) repeat protein
MGFRYAQPDNEVGFEQFCLRFYRKFWKNENLELYAKRGEKQHGIDIHDPQRLPPGRAVQCKHHEPTKTISPAEIRDEVSKAEQWPFSLEEYVIATTARKSANAQDTVVELNSRPPEQKKFTVLIHFWEEICERLGHFPHVQAQFIVYGKDACADFIASLLQDPDIASVASRLIPARVEATSVGGFEEIEQLLNGRNFEAAKHLLDKLPKADSLSGLINDDQYKIFRLRAKFATELGQFDDASRLFLAAYEKRPDLDQAKQNQVLGYMLQGNAPAAFEHARRYLKEGVATPVMICRLVENAPTLQAINEHKSLIHEHARDDEPLNLALCHKLLGFGDRTGAAEAATQALRISPESPHAHFVAALCAHNAALEGDWRDRKTHLNGAIVHYDAAVKGAREQRSLLLPEALVNRGAAHALLGDPSTAKADFRDAVGAAVNPAPYAAKAVSFFLHELDFVAASEVLDKVDRTTFEGRYLVAVTELRNPTEDAQLQRYLDELKSLADEQWPRAVECRWTYVNEALRLKKHADARSAMTEDFQNAHPFQAFTALSWIAMDSGEKAVALTQADAALAATTSDVHPQELRLLADLFMQLDEHSKALELLDGIATPGVLDDDTKCLIRCALKLERHDLLLRVCRELREAGQQDDQTRRIEIQLLDHYAPAHGLTLVDEFIEASSSPAYFIAYRNVLAIRLNKNDRLVFEPSKLPGPGDLSPKESRLVTFPYLATGRFDDALRFLYGQLRLNFDAELAHGSYVATFLLHGDESSLCQSPETVGADRAVSLQGADGEQRWVVIESENPLASRCEFPKDSELAKRLMDRKVGDVIDLPGNLVHPEKATVVAIQTKYVRAFQDSLSHFRERFPETSFIQQLHLGSGEDFDPTPLVASLTQRRDGVDGVIELYTKTLCPLHVVATRLGVNELAAIKVLATHPKGTVKCCQTTPLEFEQAVREVLSAPAIVLDISAIITLTLLEMWPALPGDQKCFVSQATKDLVDDWLREVAQERSGAMGHVHLSDDGGLVLQEDTEELRERRRAEIENLQKSIERHCECRSSEAVAALAPAKRRSYEKMAGFHSVEAASLAKDLGAVFWCDDLAVSVIAKADFGVASVWTQLALRRLADGGLLSMDDFHLASAKLASWDYVQTLWYPQTIIRAGDQANWEPGEWPLKQCIGLLGREWLPVQARPRIALDTLKLLRRSTCSEIKQAAVIQAILYAVGHWGAVNSMLNRLDLEFGIDVASASFMRFEIRAWLAANFI